MPLGAYSLFKLLRLIPRYSVTSLYSESWLYWPPLKKSGLISIALLWFPQVRETEMEMSCSRRGAGCFVAGWDIAGLWVGGCFSVYCWGDCFVWTNCWYWGCCCRWIPCGLLTWPADICCCCCCWIWWACCGFCGSKEGWVKALPCSCYFLKFSSRRIMSTSFLRSSSTFCLNCPSSC